MRVCVCVCVCVKKMEKQSIPDVMKLFMIVMSTLKRFCLY